MSHHVYTTDCIVLKTYPARESDVWAHILTPEFGLVKAAVRGIRLSHSKLRGSIQEYSLGKVSLVRGKETWRVVDAVSTLNLYSRHKHDKPQLVLLVRVLSLVRALCPAEGENRRLFETAHKAFAFLGEFQGGDDFIKKLEVLIVLRVLRSLGYLKEVRDLEGFASSENWTREVLEGVGKRYDLAIEEINRALAESHLV